MVFEIDTIIGDIDPSAVLIWLRGRKSCSIEEWNWCRFVLDVIDDSELPF